MSRPNDAEKETLRTAAESAEALLPKLEKEHADLSERIASLRSVITAWEAISGKRSQKTEKRPRASRGQVLEHIAAVLKDGGSYDEPTIREKIEHMFSVPYGRPTVYSALKRFRNKKYEYDDATKKWKMKSNNPLEHERERAPVRLAAH